MCIRDRRSRAEIAHSVARKVKSYSVDSASELAKLIEMVPVENCEITVRFKLPDVAKLLAPPIVADSGLPADPFDSTSRIGVPVAAFPRWLVCPVCRLLAPLSSGLFVLDDSDPYYPDRTVYRHSNCAKAKKPEALPARFLVACERGHLDDFPWLEFLHQDVACSSPRLRLLEYGASGEARDLEVKCDSCTTVRRLSQAFGEANRGKLPPCRGRRPHLRDTDPDGRHLPQGHLELFLG